MNFFQSDSYQSDLREAALSIVDVNNLYGKTVLVTGASGMIGSFIVDTLVYLNQHFEANIAIIALGRHKKNLVSHFGNHSEYISYLVQDVTAPFLYKENIDYIIHAASNANPSTYSSDPVGTISANLLGTENLLKVSRANGAKFIYISTGEIYGELDDSFLPFDENMSGFIDPLSVRSCYSLSKKMAENLCISYASQYGVDVVIARLSHVFGANFTAMDNRVSAVFFRNAIANQPIILKSEGKHLRSYSYLSDTVGGILSLVTAGESGQAYNVTKTDNEITMADFAKEIANVAGVAFGYEISDIESAQKTPISKAVLSDTKLTSIGYSSRVSVKTGIKRVFNILKDEKIL
ncbi:UDP-glucose 4-epimerase [Lactococcus piscium]|uniref:UDP-glucose 4-epimerase n=1 Tax=Pseudolactococcus piscium TaxID=1364 RepID=A0A2A5S1V5_9LACT|nr:NAD-dependent epimerase/dehydratase family protein [Lactococcus piscium]PCS07537.1 UDP-glucose 4-epimerase [Lactococcus piscium]